MTMSMNKLYNSANIRVGRWAQKRGPIIRKSYYKLFSEPFNREQSAVDSGIRRYKEDTGSGSDLYLLRRNVHMIEKGLTMRPRRSEFALKYIGQTIESLESILRRPAPSVLGNSEASWVLSVLDEYFEATSSSVNKILLDSRMRYQAVSDENLNHLRDSGPHFPTPIGAAVPIDALTVLAHDRRSVRWFTQEPVAREIVDKAMVVASESPTACNRQPYRFEVIDDPDFIGRVANVPMGTAGYADQLTGMVVVIGDLSAFFDERDRHLIYVDSCLASMGLIMGLETQGVSTCCINWPDIPDREDAMRKLLGFASHERVVMLIAYGYADPTGLTPYSAKRSLDSIRQYRDSAVSSSPAIH